ncbi:MAG: hypothetical protein J6J42_09755 [Lachnospiraceae bacterium]|nr:hypothetical protein [Lachnospiraceae bacterium]MBP3610607.1 hypothetical protein [Lachnospiraceae bacterium]
MTEKDKKVLENVFLANRPVACKICNGKLFYIGSGKYKCASCETEVYDDFGKVKEFLELNGPSPALLIAEKTGVSLDIIDLFLRKGRLEIIENSKYYITCEKCGCAIRYGRFCPHCARELLGGIQALFHEDTGECPKSSPKLKEGKMHFLHKK